MKIRHKDLRELYKENISEKTTGSRDSCPSPEKILDFTRSKTSEKQKTKIVDHITNCPYCTQEFEFVLKALRYEKEFNKKISNVKTKRNKTFSLFRDKRRPFFPLLSWSSVSIFVGALLIFSVASIFIFKISEKREHRGISLTGIDLIEPINKKISKSSLVFIWSKIKDYDYYIVELFDETLYPMWKSDKIVRNDTQISGDISDKLIENKKYFWMVTAFLASGNKIESRMESFILTE